MNLPTKVLLNLDLENEIAAALFGEIVTHSEFSETICFTNLDQLNRVDTNEHSAIDLYIFATRRATYNGSVAEASSLMLEEIGDRVRIALKGATIDKVILVDSAERPMQPLSDVAILGEYMEQIASELSGSALGFIFALDYDVILGAQYVPQVKNLRILDTRSSGFVQVYFDYCEETIRGLNSNFGQGSLPDIPALPSIKIEKSIEVALSSLTEI